jgi:N-acetylmuramoyl-L-alanine amidase
MMFARCRVRVSLPVLLFILLSVVSSELSYPRQWETDKAKLAYQQALQKKNSLDQTPSSSQDSFLECARTFRKVYSSDPHYRFSGEAIYEEGLIYQQLGDKFGNVDFYRTAINRFNLLVKDYEGNPRCPDALLRIAAICSNPLNDEPSAQKARQRLQTRYKYSAASILPAQADAAQKALSPEQDSLPIQQNANKPNASDNTAPAIVQDVRYKITDDSVQAIIELNAPAHYKSARLKNPDRIYFDIANARIGPNLVRNISINTPDLNRIRISQKDPATVRVVFDISNISTYTVSELRDPFIIIINFIRPAPATSLDPNAKNASPGAQPTSSETQPAANQTILLPPGESSTQSIEKSPQIKKPPATNEGISIYSPKPAPLTSRGDRTFTRMLGLKIHRIVLDPGHGGHDHGTIGPKGLCEKDLVLSLAQELQRLLEEELGAEVILTRNDDTYIPLEERTSIANQYRADLFLSIHANSSPIRSISGIESYYLDFAKTNAEREIAAKENAASSRTIGDLEDLINKIAKADKSAESRELATLVQKKLYSSARKIMPATQNRGVRSAPFVVLIGANMPSILTEVAFISNPGDERLLKKLVNRKELAKALYSGIVAYMETLGVDTAHNQAIIKK